MRYHALATDYDGTIATHGIVDDGTLDALERLRASGRKLIMVTGREMADLQVVFPRPDLFEWIVAENGAQLYRPSNQETIFLGEAPPEKFVEELRRRGVERISVGGCIVATWEPWENVVLSTIRDMGLELKVIFNKGAVMILPASINKATGLTAALERMGLSPHEVVGVGDAENDHAFFSICECSAAVANALPALKERADIQLERDHGAGVTDLIDHLLADDLQKLEGKIGRHQFLLGHRADDVEVRVKPYNNAILIAGPSGSGKSTVATGLMERLGDLGYQHCIVDPEGDFAAFEGAIVLGGANQPPATDEVLQVLKNPKSNVVVNMVGVPLADRPDFFGKLLGRLLEFRAATGRPHWLLVDEAHHLLPTAWKPATTTLPPEFNRLILVTVHPGEVSPAALDLVKLVVAVGPEPRKVMDEFFQGVGEGNVEVEYPEQAAEQVFVWSRQAREANLVRPAPCRSERRRHIRKYMSGELPIEQSFFFRGPAGKLKLRAQNLMLFLQMADGVDDETWLHHLENGDVVKWFAESIKDRELVKEGGAVATAGLSAEESRAKIRSIVERRYTLPATSYLPMPGTAAAPKA